MTMSAGANWQHASSPTTELQGNDLNDSASGPYKVNSLRINRAADPMKGSVVWDPSRSIWNGGMLAAAVVLGTQYFTWGAFFVYVLLLELTMCAGHSVGFHRRLIHRTFKCPKWVECTLVWTGTLVGMQGPYWVIQSHDFRDWAQRQADCHPYLRHGQGMLKDAVWNLHCRLQLQNPPGFDPGPGIADDADRQPRRGPGAQRAVGRDPVDGRELAQQPPRIPRVGAARPLSGTVRHRLSFRPAAGTRRTRLRHSNAHEPAVARVHFMYR